MSLMSPMDSHEPPSYILDVHNVLTASMFDQLCRDNRMARLELTSTGKMIINPFGLNDGRRSGEITDQLGNWAEGDDSGVCFGSSGPFTLPNGARRSVSAAWARRDRWETFAHEEREGFAPLCPDFVIEVRSSLGDAPPLEEKMLEFIQNGTSLAWMIDPQRKRVYIYRPSQPTEVLEDPQTVAGDPVLAGFVLYLRKIW
jgi:Uma2 family endonuclease